MGKNYCHSQLEQKRGAAVRGQSCARSLCKKLVAAAVAAAVLSKVVSTIFFFFILLFFALDIVIFSTDAKITFSITASPNHVYFYPDVKITSPGDTSNTIMLMQQSTSIELFLVARRI